MVREADTEIAERVGAALSSVKAVRVGYLFGSRARGNPRKDSDLDVALHLDPALSELARGEAKLDVIAALTDVLGGLGERSDVVDLGRASSTLGFRVLQEGIRVFERDPVERVRLEARAARRYDDDRPRRELFRVAARTANGGRARHPTRG